METEGYNAVFDRPRRKRTTSIERALDQLTPDQREAIALCRSARLSSAEAGRIMERSDAAVRQLLGRGLYRLTKLLGADFTDRGDMD